MKERLWVLRKPAVPYKAMLSRESMFKQTRGEFFRTKDNRCARVLLLLKQVTFDGLK